MINIFDLPLNNLLAIGRKSAFRKFTKTYRMQKDVEVRLSNAIFSEVSSRINHFILFLCSFRFWFSQIVLMETDSSFTHSINGNNINKHFIEYHLD